MDEVKPGAEDAHLWKRDALEPAVSAIAQSRAYEQAEALAIEQTVNSVWAALLEQTAKVIDEAIQRDVEDHAVPEQMSDFISNLRRQFRRSQGYHDVRTTIHDFLKSEEFTSLLEQMVDEYSEYLLRTKGSLRGPSSALKQDFATWSDRKRKTN